MSPAASRTVGRRGWSIVAVVPIGQFSQMTRLSLKALRLYDRNGLLPAARVDEATGYRYYDPAQACRAEAIRVLRSVDMPLDDIRAVLDADGPDAAHEHLALHRERLVERLAAGERKLAYLESLMAGDRGVTAYPVQLVHVAAQLVASTTFHTTLQRVGDDVGAWYGALMRALDRERVEPIGRPFMVLHDVVDDETDGDLEVCIPVAREISGDADVSSRQVGGGTVAMTVHQGSYLEMAPAYHTLTGWIAEHDHETTGPPREIYLNDPQSVAPEELQTRVELPVRARRSG